MDIRKSKRKMWDEIKEYGAFKEYYMRNRAVRGPLLTRERLPQTINRPTH